MSLTLAILLIISSFTCLGQYNEYGKAKIIHQTGDLNLAEVEYLKAINICDSLGLDTTEIKLSCLQGLASLYSLKGESQKEGEYLTKALLLEGNMSESHKIDRRLEFQELMVQAKIFFFNGAVEDAIRVGEEALEISIQQDTLQYEYLYAATSLAYGYFSTGDIDKLEEISYQTLSAAKKANNYEANFLGIILSNLASVSSGRNDFESAFKLYEEVIATYDNETRQIDDTYFVAMSGLGILNFQLGDYHEAKYYFELSLDGMIEMIESGKLNPGDPRLLTLLSNVAVVSVSIGEIGRAEELFFQALDMLASESTSAEAELKYNPQTYAIYSGLGDLYMTTGKLDESVKYYRKSLNELSKLNKTTSHEILIRNSLGVALLNQGNYDEAERELLNAYDLQVELSAENHSNLSKIFLSFGTLYRAIGEYEKAENYYVQSIELSKELLGESHPQYWTALSSLGEFYFEFGIYDKGFKYTLRAESLVLESESEDYQEYGVILANIAYGYGEVRDWDNQLATYKKEQEFLERNGRNLTTDYALNLNNRAIALIELQDEEKAQELLIESIELYRTLKLDSSINCALALSNLSYIYSEQGNDSLTESYAIKAMNIRLVNFGKNHSSYLSSLSELGYFYNKIGKYDKSADFYKEEQQIRLSIINENFSFMAEKEKMYYLNDFRYHFQYWRSLYHYYYNQSNSISTNFFDLELGIKDMILQGSIGLRNHLENSPDTSITADYKKWMKLNLSLANNPAPENEPGVKFIGIGISFDFPDDTLIIRGVMKNGPAYSSSLSGGDRVLAIDGVKVAGVRMAVKEITSLLSGRENTTVKLNVLNALGSNQREVSIVRGVIDTRTQASKDKEEADKLEKQLSRLSEEFKELRKQVTWDMVQSELVPNEAAIEFSSFEYIDSTGNWTDSTLYTALVLRQEDPYPRMVTLFEQKQLDALFDTTASIAMLYGRGAVPVSSNATMSYGEDLYDLVWSPLDSLLEGVDRVYFSPSGSLHKLSFSAIPYSGDTLLSDRYDLNRISSTAVLTRPSSNDRPKNMVLFGGMNYSMDTLEMKELAMATGSELYSRGLPPDLERGAETWSNLPGTLQEVQNIGTLAKENDIQVTTHTGNDAFEERYKALGGNSPDIVHLATHGFFYPDPEKQKRDGIMTGNERSSFKLSDDPLNRAGILFSGANAYWTGEDIPNGVDNGILTAKEATYIPLINTELVVLSACETGLGEIKGSEGVFGLQRAFKAAGAEYVMMSLWKVPDYETSEFMQSFYGHYLSDHTIPDSYRHAQRAMRDKYPNDPYKWAGFVLMR
jgi:CHAT domain-containing protein/tetratricopeptide (TPR) repeat protein